MKKCFMLALGAIAMVAFTSCEPTNTPGGNNGGNGDDTVVSVVKVAPETLVMSIGQTEKLSATVTPTPTTAVTFVWTSDDEEVATVKNGIVTAVAPGTANVIVSVEGCTPDTCLVNVTRDAALDNYQLMSYGLFGSPEMIPGTEQDITMTSGVVYTCQLGYISMYAWDNNVTFVNGQGFGGEGYFFIADLPVFWITEGTYAGYYVGNSEGFHIAPNPEDTIAPYYALAGELVNLQSYGDFWKILVDPTTESLTEEQYALYTDAQVGTQIFYMDFEEGSQSWYLGNVANVHMYENDADELQYNITIDWYDYVNDNRLYGLLCNVNDSGYVESLVEPYDMRIITKDYTNVVAEDNGEENAGVMFVGSKNLYRNADYAVKQVNNMKMNALYRK
ncbi:MAG: Ig-like domain-containing protein [Paludibacteraceae bacterium]